MARAPQVSNTLSRADIQFKPVGEGMDVYRILEREGFQPRQRWVLARDFRKESSFYPFPRELYRVVKTPEMTQVYIFDRPAGETYVFWRSEDQAGFYRSRIQLPRVKTQVEGAIQGSLIESILRQHPDRRLAYRFLDAFSLDRSSLHRLPRNSTFKIEFEEWVEGEVSLGMAEILKIELDIPQQKTLRRILYQWNQGKTFVDPDGDLQARPLYLPVHHLNISSHFSPRRFHPVKKRYRAHLGTDFVGPLGSPVLAAEDGVIARFGKQRGAGRYVVIQHANGFETFYNHLNSIRSTLQVGQKIKGGQRIGTLGCTGYCTSPHLHFAVKKHGRFVDPTLYVKVLPKNHVDLAQLESLLSKAN